MPTMLTKQDKEEIKEIVVDVIQDVVMPAFGTLATKEDLKRVETRLENRINGVENRLEQVDRKLDIVAARTLDNDVRINKLETKIATS